jgi:hypothetical protein
VRLFEEGLRKFVQNPILREYVIYKFHFIFLLLFQDVPDTRVHGLHDFLVVHFLQEKQEIQRMSFKLKVIVLIRHEFLESWVVPIDLWVTAWDLLGVGLTGPSYARDPLGKPVRLCSSV